MSEIRRDETSWRAVLAATDFSPAADRAVGWAAALALAHGARLHLVHAVIRREPPIDHGEPPPDVSSRLLAVGRRRLEQEVSRWRARGFDVEAHARLGPPPQVAVEVATEIVAGVAVVGTRGLGGVRHLLLGSTAERVIQLAPCPVLCVHDGDPEPALPEHPQRVLVPTDFSHDAVAAAEALLSAFRRREHPPGVVLLHVLQLPPEYAAYGLGGTGALPLYGATLPAVEERLRKEAGLLEARGFAVETAVREGPPGELIVEEARARKVELIAMGSHGRSGLSHLLLGSTAERVVQRASCPVLTVRLPKQ